MGKDLKTLLREGLFKLENGPAKRRQIKNLHRLVEKKIRVGDNITKKLNRVNTTLSKNLLNFINSDKIKDDANVDYVDYENKNEKLFTVGYEDQRGNAKERLMKFNKLLTYLGGSIENIKSYEVEELMNHLKQADLDNLRVVEGEDILWAYHCNNYDGGESMGSCMRYEHAQKYLEIYTANPKQVKCLVLVNPENNKVRGRALLWYCDDGSVFMDRVYVTNNQYKVEFNSYAETHNIKTGSPSDEVTLDVGGEYDYYPYMDTFEYYSPYNDTLSTSDGELHLQDTNGGDSSGVYSDYHDRTIPEDDACYCDHLDSYMECDELVQDVDGEYVYPESDDIIELTNGSHDGEYCKVEDVAHTHDGWYVHIDDAIYIDKGDGEGEYAMSDDVVEDYEGYDVLRDSCRELTLGEFEGGYAIYEDTFTVSKDGEFVGYMAENDGELKAYEEQGYDFSYSG
jgi:hypothetical protein